MSAPRISWVNSIRNAETRSVDARDIVERIRDGEWQQQIAEVRAGKRPKNSLPAVMPSGVFSSRNGTNGSVAENLTQHSGVLCADLDNLGGELEVIRGQINSSKYVCASFVSPGGNGLKVWCYVSPDASLHAASFRAVEKYVLELTSVQIDQACKDVGRLCFISADYEAYYNPNRCELAPLPEPERSRPSAVIASRNGKPSEAEIRQMLAVIPKRPDYPDWIKIASAVADAVPNDEAIALLNEWSPEERRGEYADKLRHRLRDVHIGTLIHLARQCGYEYADPKIHGRLSGVEMKPIVYLSKPLWQRGTFTLVTGKKNSGKSSMLIHEAARLTRGELGEKDLVMWIPLGEDNLAMDVRPRMEAVGADCSKVIVLKWPLVLPRDIAELKRIAAEEGHRVGMIVIDPISGAVPMGANTNLDTDVRKIIEGLNDLAAEIDALIVGVRHLKKSVSGDIIDNVMGSGDWVNVPRVVLACAKDKDDEAIRHIKVVTGNRMPAASEGLQFRLESAHVVAGGEPVLKAVLLGESCEDINALCQTQTPTPNTKSQLARQVILDTLEAAPGMEMESDTLDAEVAKIAETSVHTVISQRKKLRTEGLIKPVAYRTGESGAVKSWGVKRTNTPRR
jgi:hypothetical protein